MRGEEYHAPVGVYSGDSDPKRIERFYSYERTNLLYNAGVRPEGDIITLTGKDAADVGPIKYILGWPPDKVHFVDTKMECLTVAAARWPEAKRHLLDIRTVLKNFSNPIALLNLDFCGQFNEVVEETLKLARGMIAIGGIVSLTYGRGRDGKRIHRMSRKEIIEEEKMDVERMKVYSSAMRKALTERGDLYEPIFTLMYRSDTYPMGVIAFQNMPKEYQSKSWGTALWMKTNRGCVAGRHRFTKLYPHEIERLIKSTGIALGLTRGHEVAGEILNVLPGTIAAWEAHLTRGTYSKSGSDLEISV